METRARGTTGICHGFVQTQADRGSVSANDERPLKPGARNRSTLWRGLDGHGETCAARTPLGAAEGGPLRQAPYGARFLATLTMGLWRVMPPVDPRKGASPKVKTPPSEAISQ